jgi:hypothetical protein
LCAVISHKIFFTTEGHTFNTLSASFTKTVGNKAESLRETNILRSTKLFANPVTFETVHTKDWTNENLVSIIGKGKNIALPQFARPVLVPTQSPLHWLMEISGRG